MLDASLKSWRRSCAAREGGNLAIRRYLAAIFIAMGLTVTCWAAASLDQIAKSIVDTTQSTGHGSFINDNFAKDVAAKLSPPAGQEAEEALDFDIFTYSQDPDYEQVRKSIKSEVKQTDDSNAIIKVTFTQYDDEVIVEYRLKKSGERWLIDDVVYPNDDVSLRSELDLK
jgi:hypothetical protein